MSTTAIIIAWIVLSAAMGFAIAALFAGFSKLPRNVYLLFYVPAATAILAGYAIWSGLDIAALFGRNWAWGLFGAVIVSAILVRNVLRQLKSHRRTGVSFVIDLIWPGLFYGVVDALLLSIFPIVAVNTLFSEASWTYDWIGRILVGATALVASISITFAYHAGYREFRNRSIWMPVLGNIIMSIAFIVTLSPIAAIVPHMVMHVASVIHGSETTIQLPPHYEWNEPA